MTHSAPPICPRPRGVPCRKGDLHERPTPTRVKASSPELLSRLRERDETYASALQGELGTLRCASTTGFTIFFRDGRGFEAGQGALWGRSANRRKPSCTDGTLKLAWPTVFKVREPTSATRETTGRARREEVGVLGTPSPDLISSGEVLDRMGARRRTWRTSCAARRGKRPKRAPARESWEYGHGPNGHGRPKRKSASGILRYPRQGLPAFATAQIASAIAVTVPRLQWCFSQVR